MTIDTEEFLAHYGVKGMKWGVRKAVNAPVAVGSAVGTRVGRAIRAKPENVKPKAAMSKKRKVAIGAATVVGAAFLRSRGIRGGVVVAGLGAVSIAAVRRSDSTKAGEAEAKRQAKALADMPMSQIKKSNKKS